MAQDEYELMEALIEFRRVGAYVKVSAIDPVTNTEVSIVGDPKRGEKALKDAACNRLRYVLRKASKKDISKGE